MQPFLTPLRYPGGKGRLAQCVADLIRANDLDGGHYVEPFAGGAGVAISLLVGDLASQIHINDLNRSVHAFWHSVLTEPDSFCALVRRTRVCMTQWRRQREIQASLNASPLELGFSTFFLNRVNRSGIIMGGVIGGQAQSGKWRLDARYNKEELIKRIQRIARMGDRISLYNMDATTFVQSIVPKLPHRMLCYLDPPYYVKGKGLYEDHYIHQDHAALAETVSNLDRPWIVSYDNVPEISTLYKQFRNRIFGLHYSAQDRYRGSEIMFFSRKLAIPDEVVPSRARAA